MTDRSLFIGAGVSKPYPACAPTSQELKTLVLDAAFRAASPYLESAQDGSSDLAKLIEGMPLEVFVQQWVNAIGPLPIRWLKEPLSRGKPNECHLLIARLLARGALKHVLTTNFDTYVEQALKSLSVRQVPGTRCGDRKPHVHILSIEREFELPDCADSCVIKLHGTIESEKSVRLTMQQVGTTLPPMKRKVLESVFDTCKVGILGYSGRDLDINYTLGKMYKESWKVAWIARTEDSVGRAGELYKILRPLTSFSDMEWYLHQLELSLLGVCGCAPDEPAKHPCPECDSAQWMDSVEPWTVLSTVADIADASDPRSALGWRMDALRYAERKSGNNDILPPSIVNIGFTLLKIGEYQRSIDHMLPWEDKLQNWKTSYRANWHSTLGSCYFRRKSTRPRREDLEDALVHYEKAIIEWASLAHRIETECPTTADYIDVVLSRPLALEHEAWVNKAAVILELGDVENAESILVTSSQVLENLGEVSMLSICLFNLGMAYLLKRDFDKARSILHDCLTLKRAMGDKTGVQRIHSYLMAIPKKDDDEKDENR